ncbi:MAG: BrnT family toxin [Candidatus Omnitrophica bacterium]|nr:BrnT family toxin [Candidatus Omnitrophota bacterium]
MENIYWDPAKNQKLKEERGISFEEILVCIKNQQVLAIIQNPSKKYKNQRVFVVELNDYVYYVPFANTEDGLFLKTIIPSRKLTKEYLRQGGDQDA